MSAASNNERHSKPLFPPPPPLSLPVWSLATPSSQVVDNQPSSLSSPTTSMNIVTFASAVSVAAPTFWMISLYHNTLTKDSFCSSGQGVLQLLTPEQKKLTPLLGKRSGYQEGYSKLDACQAQGFPWVVCDGFWDGPPPIYLLPRCAAYLHVRLRSTLDAGDHLVTICELVNTGIWDENEQTVKKRSLDDPKNIPMDENNVLYTGLLRKEGIL